MVPVGIKSTREMYTITFTYPFIKKGIRLQVLLLASLLRLVYQRAIRPPPPRICGAPGGPPVTAPRVKLRDGRHLAYLETGVPRAAAAHKIIFVHGFDSCRHDVLPASQDLLRRLRHLLRPARVRRERPRSVPDGAEQRARRAGPRGPARPRRQVPRRGFLQGRAGRVELPRPHRAQARRRRARVTRR